ncbi:hypothetical protein AAG906_002593 [Vitis piasezkii]
MVWMNYYLHRVKQTRMWVAVCLCWLCLMFATPKIPHSPKHHLFADMRNFLGVPNTLNVITNYPFLVLGVLGFVLCLSGNFFVISSRAEVWGWALYYAGTTSVAFGSSYYHLKPDDNRVIWDKLPIMIAYSSLFASFIMERVGEMIGLTCLFTLNLVALVGVACERAFNDLRLCMMFQLIPGIAIPAMTFMFTPKYTHSRYWLCATGVYLLAKFESVADNKVYRATWYLISGHSLEHLCSVIFPVLLTLMLIFRSIKTPRLGDVKDRL